VKDIMKGFLNTASERTRWIKSLACDLGFDYCGIAKAAFLEDDAKRLEKWLQVGMHGAMSYMERNFDKRVDPRLLVPNAKSVITLMFNYYPTAVQVEEAPKISKYAYGNDYHEVIRAKLNDLLLGMRTHIGQVDGRGFVDSAPVLERAWAQKSGLGWIGKNGNLINKKAGSFYFLATLIVDVEFEYDDPYAKDFCGTCTKCIDACPTDAIVSPSVVDGSKCISYLTIELKQECLPDEFKNKMDNWAFGCDVCQDVCPWNRFATEHSHPELQPINELMNFSIKDWLGISQDLFNKILKLSPIKRTKYKGFMRNLKFVYEK
jgi:epoxyqueuosine reductase